MTGWRPSGRSVQRPGSAVRGRAEDGTGAAPSVWIVLPTDEPDDVAEQLARSLRERGATVSGPSGDLPDRPVDAVLAVLPDRDLDGVPDHVPGFEERLAPWQDVLVPVAVGTHAAKPEFEDVSQIVLGLIGEARAVELILLVARIGGPALADLVRLTGAAERWDLGGRPRSLLLRGPQVETALPLLAHSATLHDQARMFREYVGASVAARRRRNRTILALATAVTLVLVLVSVVAFGQQRSAADATDVFHVRQGHAESVRFASLATGLIGVDPDLPWVLGQQALAAQDTPEAEDAARKVLTAVPQHRTVPLPGLPTGLSSDLASRRIAVVYTDGRVDVRSADDGHLLRTLPVTGGDLAVAVALAPSGHTVAVLGMRTTRLVGADDGRTLRTLSDDHVFAGWVDDDHLLEADSGALGVLDVRTGDVARTSVTLSATDEPRAYSVSRDGRTATLLDGDDVISLDLTTGQALPALRVAGAVDVATAADGSTAEVVTSTDVPQLVTRQPGGLTAADSPGGGTNVSTFGDGYVTKQSTGQVDVVVPTQRAAARQFVAHRGPVSGAEELPGGRLATIGADRYLRLWNFNAELVRYPRPGYALDLTQRSSSTRAETFRPLIALDPAAHRLTYTLQSPASVGTVDTTTLRPVGATAEFGDITVLTRPLATAGQLAVVRDSGASGVWALPASGSGNPTARWTCSASSSMQLAAMLFGSSPDGVRLAVASPEGLTSWTADACTSELTRYGGQIQQPVAVLVDGDHHASAVTTSGIWWREGMRPVFLTTPDTSVTAATLGPHGELYYVTDTGGLFVNRTGSSARIGTVPDGLAPFALRVSPDGRLVGAVGIARAVVLDGTDGHLLVDLSPDGSAGSEIRDLALDGDTVWAIRADDALVRRPVLGDAAVRSRLADQLPRAMTADERSSLAAATTIGGS